MTTRADLTL